MDSQCLKQLVVNEFCVYTVYKVTTINNRCIHNHSDITIHTYIHAYYYCALHVTVVGISLTDTINTFPPHHLCTSSTVPRRPGAARRGAARGGTGAAAATGGDAGGRRSRERCSGSGPGGGGRSLESCYDLMYPEINQDHVCLFKSDIVLFIMVHCAESFSQTESPHACSL